MDSRALSSAGTLSPQHCSDFSSIHLHIVQGFTVSEANRFSTFSLDPSESFKVNSVIIGYKFMDIIVCVVVVNFSGTLQE